MKLSVSIGDTDVELLDRYTAMHGVDSRSAVVRRAVALPPRAATRSDDSAAAWDEWRDGDDDLWESTVGDGLLPSAD